MEAIAEAEGRRKKQKKAAFPAKSIKKWHVSAQYCNMLAVCVCSKIILVSQVARKSSSKGGGSFYTKFFF